MEVPMTELDERLRDELHRVADTVVVPDLPTGAAYRSIRRRTLVLPAIAAAAAVVLALITVGLVLNNRSSGIPPADGGPASWPARGPRAGDARLIDAAVRTWDAALVPKAELPHRDVHVLYAGHTVAGNAVVLTGEDALGNQRVAWLNTDAASTTPFRHRLHIVKDVLAPTGREAGVVAFYEWRPTTRPTNDHVLIAIAPPGTKNLQWRDDINGWRPLPTFDGASVVVHASTNDSMNVSVRAGDNGNGVATLGFPFMSQGYFTAIDHELGPGEYSSSDSETCKANVCSASAGAGSGSGTVGGPTNRWTDLRQPFAHFGADGTGHGQWTEFAAEADLLGRSRFPGDAWSSAAPWSALLPDGTGLLLENYTPSGQQQHLLLYVDRPEWDGGRLGADITPTTAVAALGVVVPVHDAQELVVVLADGLHAQWRTSGRSWQNMSLRHNAATADVTGIDSRSIDYRVLNESNIVVAQGQPLTAMS